MKQLKEGQTTIMRNQRALGYSSSKLAHRATWILGALITISITINVFMYVQWNTRRDEESSALSKFQAYQAMDAQHKHDVLLSELGVVDKQLQDVFSDVPKKMLIDLASMHRYIEEHGIEAWDALAAKLPNRYNSEELVSDPSPANAPQ